MMNVFTIFLIIIIIFLRVGDKYVVVISFADTWHKKTLFSILTLVAEKNQNASDLITLFAIFVCLGFIVFGKIC